VKRTFDPHSILNRRRPEYRDMAVV